MSATTTLALRYLLRRKTRALLTSLAIVFGVALVVAMGGLVPTLTASMTSSVLSSVEHVDLSLSSATHGAFPENTAEQLRSVAGVSKVSGRLAGLVSLNAASAPQVDGKPLSAVQLIGVDLTDTTPVRALIVTTGALTDDGLLISENLRDQSKLKLGDAFLFPAANGSATLKVSGFVAAPPGGIEVVYASLPSVQTILGKPGALTQLDLLFAANVNTESTRAAVLTAAGPGFVAQAARNNSQLLDQVSRMAMPMQAFGVLAMVLAGFIIFITFRTVVVERRRDLGLLRALGATRSTVLAMVTIEGLLLGVVGTAVGILVGVGLERLVVSGLAPVWRSQVGLVLEPQPIALKTVLLSVLLGVGGSVLSCLAPARQASRVSPREAMRPSGGEARLVASRARVISGTVLAVLSILGLLVGSVASQTIGVFLFIAAVFFLGPALIVPLTGAFRRALGIVLSQEARIAQGNVGRQRHRSAITASVMAVALAIIVSLAALTASTIEGIVSQVDRTMRADFMVLPPTLNSSLGAVGAGPELARALSQVEGVDVATGLRIGPSKAGELDVMVVGLDPTAFPKVGGLDFEQGSAETAFTELAQPRTFIANPMWAQQKQLKVGDVVPLLGPKGPMDYRLIAVGTETLNYRFPSAYIAQTNLEADFGLTSDTLLFVTLKKGTPLEQVRAALKKPLEAWPGFVLHATGEWRDRMMEDGRKKLNAMYVLLVVLVVPALIALANTLGINVLERIREIGLLRAIGSTRQQVRRIVLAESLLLASTGALTGIAVGLWMGLVWVRAMASFGLSATFHVPVSAVAFTAVLALVFGALAAFFPARHAAKLKIVSALRHE